MQQRQIETVEGEKLTLTQRKKMRKAAYRKKSLRWKTPNFEVEGLTKDRTIKPTMERMSQLDGVRKDMVYENPNSAPRPQYRGRAECILDGYLIRMDIDHCQHAAGVLFRDAYQRAVLRIQTRNLMSIVVDEQQRDVDGKQARESKARQHYKDAMKALSMEQREVIIDVCGHDQTAGGNKKLKVLSRGLQILSDLWHTNRDDDFIS